MVNFDKTQPAPDAVAQDLAREKAKISGTYRTEDVIKQIHTDFKGKCYVCECKGLTSINVEHFVPHKGDRDVEFDWDNLYLSCGHCNNTKLAKAVYDNILDCCNPAHRVDEWIKYEKDAFPKGKIKITALLSLTDNKEIVANTVELLQKIYEGTTIIKSLEAEAIREQLKEEMAKFRKNIRVYYDSSTSSIERSNTLLSIKRQLKKSSPFTAFKRWVVRENERLKQDFEQYFD